MEQHKQRYRVRKHDGICKDGQYHVLGRVQDMCRVSKGDEVRDGGLVEGLDFGHIVL